MKILAIMLFVLLGFVILFFMVLLTLGILSIINESLDGRITDFFKNIGKKRRYKKDNEERNMTDF